MATRNRRLSVALILVALAAALLVAGLWSFRRLLAPAATPAVSSSGPRLAPTARRAPWQPIYLSSAETEASADDSIGSFSGRVVSSADFSPVPGAEITFIDGAAAHTVSTDASGSFEFQPPREGVYRVQSITKDGFVPFSPELGQSPVSLTARKGQRVRAITLVLSLAVVYMGKVVDPDNRAVQGATVRVMDLFGEPLRVLGSAEEHVSNADGEFEFRAPDGALLEARHPGYASGRARLDFAAQVSHRVVIRMRAAGEPEASHTIAGRVVDRDGNPVGAVSVTANPERDSMVRTGARATTDADGRFAIVPLAAGRYTVLASEPGSAPAVRRHVPAPAADIELVLGAAATLSGRVTEAETGRPISAFSVVVSQRMGPLAIETTTAVSVFDADGRYQIDDLAPGTYLVTASARGRARAKEREIALDESGASADFTLAQGARLVGVVRDDASREPLAGAKISLEGRTTSPRHGEEHGVPLVSVAVTDEGGAFELLGLPPGEHSALVAAAKHHGRIFGPFSVRESETIGPVEIALTPTKDGEDPRIELFGIGAVLTIDGEVLRIQRVIDGGGAAEKGLVPGDAIVEVEGVSVLALGFEGAIQRIRGPEGSFVRLTLERAGAEERTALAVPRRRIRT